MNKKTLDHLLIALTVLFDLCFVATAIVVAYWVRFESGWTPEALALHKGGTPPLDDYFRLIPLMAIIWLMTLKALKLYRPESSATLSAFWTLCKASGIALIATLAALFFIYHHDAYSRWVMLLASGFSLIWLFLGRLVLHRFRQAIHAQGVGVSRVALIGYDARAEQFIDVLKARPNSGYELVGIVAETVGVDEPAVPSLGESQYILEIVQKHRLDTLFISSPTVPNETILQILHACEGVPVQINVFPELSEFIKGGTETITFFQGIPVLQLQEMPMQGVRGIVKRLMDIVFSLLALIVLSPLMLTIAVIIRLTSPGKAIFRQERVGRAGKPFNIYKFRSMRADAEAKVGHVWAETDDPRQTSLGKFLRRWSLDELPQFFNVFKGDMSLVGPRPEMSGLIDTFSESIPHYLARQRVKSGMTGWAQVNGLRGNTSLEERISYDRYYIENWSLALDIKIILKTLWAIKKGSR
ncbi:undecaprenyl-phosphate glucose phosphotransferase [Candidatus Poribacteria bacterium]|nr:undecaprenyl-phosphate glucose phosphotransferase [Candidatus Poribacteria bacterium]MYH80638.1 undecaprenyl-phosphate glucose phosphotransferase [Candidatus Poribacteria bacterium]MYK95407.1 undecaprenyl-phosphate glucose phosphotransferase [Candidatus Poribacteria bacterium]